MDTFCGAMPNRRDEGRGVSDEERKEKGKEECVV
jgi:hypothetical protein